MEEITIRQTIVAEIEVTVVGDEINLTIAPTAPLEIVVSMTTPGPKGEPFTYEDFTEEQLLGLVGPQGPQGEQGPVGATGAKGDQGEVGPRGLQGIQGIQGEPGPQGEIGPTGPQGATGATGPQGPQGIKGDTGAQGLKGDTGLTGPQGIQGEPGPAGPKGDDGAQGPQGIQGPKGDPFVYADFTPEQLVALTGPQGERGPIGETGPQGPQGIKGDTGLTGATGPQGEQGLQGIQGEVGPQGPKGDTGDQGIQGLQGPKGDTGDAGPQGIQGPAGNDGAQGPQGIQGIQGPAGADGATGPKGDKGDTGDTGPQGVQGVQGPAGANGADGVGVPTGGTAGQVLAKIDGTNHNTQWVDPSGGASYQNAIDEPPASPHAKDDEFDGTSLNSKWSWYNQSTSSIAIANGRLVMDIAPFSDNESGLLQTAPTGDFEITAKVSIEAKRIGGKYYTSGIALHDSATGRHLTIAMASRPDATCIFVTKPRTADNYLTLGYNSPWLYVKVKVAGTTLSYWFSTTGDAWIKAFEESLSTWQGAITHIGIFANRNDNDSNNKSYAIFDWFRVTE